MRNVNTEVWQMVQIFQWKRGCLVGCCCFSSFFFLHINVLMYIAQIVENYSRVQVGLKIHHWRKVKRDTCEGGHSSLVWPSHHIVLQRVGKDVTKFIVERATHTHRERESHTHATRASHWQWGRAVGSGETTLPHTHHRAASLPFKGQSFKVFTLMILSWFYRGFSWFFSPLSLQTLDSFSGLRCNYVQVLSCCLRISTARFYLKSTLLLLCFLPFMSKHRNS